MYSRGASYSIAQGEDYRVRSTSVLGMGEQQDKTPSARIYKCNCLYLLVDVRPHNAYNHSRFINWVSIQSSESVQLRNWSECETSGKPLASREGFELKLYGRIDCRRNSLGFTKLLRSIPYSPPM